MTVESKQVDGERWLPPIRLSRSGGDDLPQR
jgi:hypothetical protein